MVGSLVQVAGSWMWMEDGLVLGLAGIRSYKYRCMAHQKRAQYYETESLCPLCTSIVEDVEASWYL